MKVKTTKDLHSFMTLKMEDIPKTKKGAIIEIDEKSGNFLIKRNLAEKI